MGNHASVDTVALHVGAVNRPAWGLNQRAGWRRPMFHARACCAAPPARRRRAAPRRASVRPVQPRGGLGVARGRPQDRIAVRGHVRQFVRDLRPFNPPEGVQHPRPIFRFLCARLAVLPPLTHGPGFRCPAVSSRCIVAGSPRDLEPIAPSRGQSGCVRVEVEGQGRSAP